MRETFRQIKQSIALSTFLTIMLERTIFHDNFNISRRERKGEKVREVEGERKKNGEEREKEMEMKGKKRGRGRKGERGRKREAGREAGREGEKQK